MRKNIAKKQVGVNESRLKDMSIASKRKSVEVCIIYFSGCPCNVAMCFNASVRSFTDPMRCLEFEFFSSNLKHISCLCFCCSFHCFACAAIYIYI